MKKRRIGKHRSIKRKKPIFRNRFFWIFVLLLLLSFLTLRFLFFSRFFEVKNIIISGNKKIPVQEIREIVEKNLEKKILFFNSKSIFLINLNKINQEILNNFLKIATARIVQDFPETLEIVISEREPVAIWCKEEICFLLDKEGVIFEKTLPGKELTKIINTQESASTLGKKVIEESLLSQILEIEMRLKGGFRIVPLQTAILSQERLNIQVSEGWEIYFNPREDIEWQLMKLKVDLEGEIPPEKRKDLEYIELRFGNFAPYKYRDLTEAAD